MSYSERLKSPHWQRKRLEIMQRDNFTCQHCGDTETFFNVHHLIYLPNREPWDYEDSFLITLCEVCHTEEEKHRELDTMLLGSFLLTGLSRRDLMAIAIEMRRHLEHIPTRKYKFVDLIDYLNG
jgi:hypothetical protein